ncbi:MAG: hypothetical protein RIB01_15215 [Balneola sp.]
MKNLKLLINRSLLVGVFLLMNQISAYAQWDEAEQAAEDFQDFIFSIAPIAFVVILIMSVVFNIGKIMGDNKDYKAFFTGIALYVLAISITIGIVAYIGSVSF